MSLPLPAHLKLWKLRPLSGNKRQITIRTMKTLLRNNTKSLRTFRLMKISVGAELHMTRREGSPLITSMESPDKIGARTVKIDTLTKDTKISSLELRDRPFRRSTQKLTSKSGMRRTAGFTSLSLRQRSLVLRATNSNFNCSRVKTMPRESMINSLFSVLKPSMTMWWWDWWITMLRILGPRATAPENILKSTVSCSTSKTKKRPSSFGKTTLSAGPRNSMTAADTTSTYRNQLRFSSSMATSRLRSSTRERRSKSRSKPQVNSRGRSSNMKRAAKGASDKVVETASTRMKDLRVETGS